MDTGEDIWLTVSEAAALTGYSVSTLQRWDRNGTLRANRTLTNQRRYKRAELLAATTPAPPADISA